MSATTSAGFPGEAVPTASVAMPAWQSILSHVAAVSVAIIFLGAGIGKIVVPYMVQQLFENLLVSAKYSLPLVVALGIAETLGGVLVLIPRYRRWGALLISFLLLVFMGYIGLRYNELVGKDCSCFPWLKRAVNPAFFLEDGAMLAAAVVAGWLSMKPRGLRFPAMQLAGVVVASGASLTYSVMHQSGIQVPATITVDGKPYNLREGRVFLFFYDPSCSHCEDAAKHMATYKWKSDVTFIGLPTNDPQWAESFMKATKFNMHTSSDTVAMRQLFSFTYPPYAVAVDHGRVKGMVSHYEEPEPEPTLKQLGYID